MTLDFNFHEMVNKCHCAYYQKKKGEKNKKIKWPQFDIVWNCSNQAERNVYWSM